MPNEDPADLKPLIRKLVSKTDLTDYEISKAFDIILEGKSTEATIASFLTALSMKVESPREIGMILRRIKEHAVKITPKVNGRLIDNCGTGGDSIRSFNISTAAAIVASAAGAMVAKHGNRSVSGFCGSADFMEYVGYDLTTSPSKVQSTIEDIGLGFLFAPKFHPAMQNVVPARKAIGIRTVFNIVGPLSNPCTNISGQVIGVFEPALQETLSEVLRESNGNSSTNLMLVHAVDGFDELSNTCENDIIWLVGNQIKRIRLHPKVVNIELAKLERLIVNSKENSIKDTIQTIYGKSSKEKQDIVVLNASAALVVGGVTKDLKEGVQVAREAVKNGRAQKKLSQLIQKCGDKRKLEEAEKKFL